MKVAIIGSGISGLYSGYKLKKKGYDIDIYEKNNIIGGRVKVVKFDDIDVVAGAGILRYNKDVLTYKFLKELNVNMNKYKANYSYTFDQYYILEFVEYLKKVLKNIEKNINKEDFSIFRSKTIFSKFGKEYLGEETYDYFVKSCGFSDFEKADIIDTLYDYGFEDCVSGYEAVSIKWVEFLRNIYDKLQNNIHLKTPIKKIKYTEDNKFIIKDKIYDKVIISTDVNTIRKLIDDKIYKEIQGQTFVRLYVKLNKPLNLTTNFVITDKPFQKIIEMNKEKSIYMISYSDNKIANRWKYVKDIRKTVERGIKNIFGLDIKVLKHKLIYWKLGTHYYKPLKPIYKDRNEFLKIAQNPRQNMYIVGEGFSKEQGWCEGALQSVEKILKDF
jgi:protoporphyrinogen oxidase